MSVLADVRVQAAAMRSEIDATGSDAMLATAAITLLPDEHDALIAELKALRPDWSAAIEQGVQLSGITIRRSPR